MELRIIIKANLIKLLFSVSFLEEQPNLFHFTFYILLHSIVPTTEISDFSVYFLYFIFVAKANQLKSKMLLLHDE